MKKYGLILTFLLILTGCGEEPAIPAEFAKLCEPAYDKKRVETVGYLGLASSTSCSSYGGARMDCILAFTGAPNENSKLEETGYVATVEKGDGNNMMADPGKNYTKSSLKIKDNTGKEVSYRDKVKIVASVQTPPNPDGSPSKCTLSVYKIEKQ